MNRWTAPPIQVPRGTRRVELVFTGVEQAGPSFEGRVFLNRPDADERTPRTPEAGYAGSFHVYGYGETLPPALTGARRDLRPVAPIEKRLVVDEATCAAEAGSPSLSVTVVAVPVDAGTSLEGQPFRRVDARFDA
jgi:hypothetical protein